MILQYSSIWAKEKTLKIKCSQRLAIFQRPRRDISQKVLSSLPINTLEFLKIMDVIKLPSPMLEGIKASLPQSV